MKSLIPNNLSRNWGASRLVPLLLMVAVAGCGGSDRADMAPVTGHVTYKGKPVANAVVTFRGPNAARFASGTTDSDGAFTLSTYEPGDGALIGENIVAVAIAEDIDPSMSREEFSKMKAAQRKPAKSPIPLRFADPKTSGLSVTVTEGPNDITLDLPE